MFKRYDEQFERTAADPLRRRAAIGDLSLRRTILFWCALVTTACALVVGACALVGRLSGSSAVAAALYFAAAVHWSSVFKFESELRLLRVIERLHVSRNEEPSD
jgi:hypothetical protein